MSRSRLIPHRSKALPYSYNAMCTGIEVANRTREKGRLLDDSHGQSDSQVPHDIRHKSLMLLSILTDPVQLSKTRQTTTRDASVSPSTSVNRKVQTREILLQTNRSLSIAVCQRDKFGWGRTEQGRCLLSGDQTYPSIRVMEKQRYCYLQRLCRPQVDGNNKVVAVCVQKLGSASSTTTVSAE